MPDVSQPPIGLIPLTLYRLFGPSYRTTCYGFLAFITAIMAGVAQFLPAKYGKIASGIATVVTGAMTGLGLWSAKDKKVTGSDPGSE